ncbi:helix-turn-helix domain-containing protein [Staphylococcus hominis]|uniref:helix-turn-helix domain-containing protein n=1 Tax=Staphylococcus hominis TaxID=1290 RepID=UPI0025561A41|nr:helix-turn-helix transcriptional regulator [Staphylococcus hominis]MDK7301303.1 helix-turn-helix transcriptional regulator [Staphylococcus hominis]
MNEFGEKIRELRGKESLRSASRNIGISHTYLDSLEKGFDPRTNKERKPTIEVLHKISKYYDYDFFDLSSLAGVFVSINDTPDEVKKEEIKKMKEKFREYFNDNENKIKQNFIDLVSRKLSYKEVIFWQNIYNFYDHEKDSDDIQIEGESDKDILILVASIFKFLLEHKNSNNEEIYEDTVNDFSKFLKAYFNIK